MGLCTAKEPQGIALLNTYGQSRVPGASFSKRILRALLIREHNHQSYCAEFLRESGLIFEEVGE